MQILPTDLHDVYLIKSKKHFDDRGWFMETYNESEFFKSHIDYLFVQDNHSRSKKNVLRGMHMQDCPFGQAKLVRCIRGSILDVVVDLDKNSPTYLKHIKVVLDDSEPYSLLVGDACAHGFLTLSDTADIIYKVSNVYNKTAEVSYRWNSAAFNIDWGIDNPILSDKDANAPIFHP